MTRRLLATYLGLTLLILGSLEVPLAISYRDRLDTELSADLVRDGFAIAGFAEETVEGTGTVDLGTLTASYASRSGARVIIVDQDGKVLADSQPEIGSNDFSSRPEVAAALRGEVSTGTRRSDTLDTELLFAAVPIASGGQVHGAVRTTYSTRQLDERLFRYVMTLLSVAAVCIVAAALLGVFFARWVARPLQRLEDAAASLGAGHLDARADVDSGPPEVRQLAAAFDAMAAEIDELVEAQAAFVADASHELRSPLAALRLRIENVQSELDPSVGGDAREDLEAALAETARLSRIVDGLLALARADRAGEVGSSGGAVIDVQALFEARRDAWQAYASDRGVDVSAVPCDLTVVASEDRLIQALDNLVANAIEAAAGTPDARIVLHAGHGVTASVVELHVVDNGPGMADVERARAFDRFWRAARSSSTGRGPADAPVPTSSGSGLGLAIARKLVRADHGDITLAAAETGGLDAVIRLPAPSR